MKHILLLLCLTGFTHLAIGQSNRFQLGLLVKGGNFTTPNAKSEEREYHTLNKREFVFRPGYQYTFGMYGAYKFNAQFSVQSELSYRLSYFERHINQNTQFWDSSGIRPGKTINILKTEIGSLNLPVKFQFTPRKSPKFHLTAGAGISHNFSYSNKSMYRSTIEGFAEFESRYEYHTNGWELSDFRMHYTAGVHYQINPNTILGLEYLFERYYEQKAGRFFSRDPLIDFIALESFIPSMHSFSVSLRHNLLH